MDFTRTGIIIIDMITLSAFLLIGILEVSCVKINQLLVPDMVSPSGVPVILDCDYFLEFPKDEGLVVKWFFNERVYPVYQWIPDARPQELGILKGRLDLSYEASEDRHTIHRALKIIKLGPELSGSFTCSVSTFSSEDSQTKKMLVFVPEKSLVLKYPSPSPIRYRNVEASKMIFCYAEEVFPKPELRLFLNGSEVENCTKNNQERNNGLFYIELTAEGQDLVDGTEILCELRVPEANYTVRREAIYYQDWNRSSSTSQSLYNLIRIALACIFLWFS